jgi:hypothetical protein
MEDLVTLEQAKKHLRLSGSHEDDDLRMKLTQAQDIIIDYLDESRSTEWAAEMDAWTEETVPERVRGAILLQCAELVRFRGDDVDEPKRERGSLSPAIVAYLNRTRMPVIA